MADGGSNVDGALHPRRCTGRPRVPGAISSPLSPLASRLSHSPTPFPYATTLASDPLCVCVSLSLSFFHARSFALALCLSLARSLALSLARSLSRSLVLSLSLFLSPSLLLSRSLSLSLALCPSRAFALRLSSSGLAYPLLLPPSIHQPSEYNQIGFSRFVVCTGALRNPATFGTNQGN